MNTPARVPGWSTDTRRVGALSLPGSRNVEPGPSQPAERIAESSCGIDVAAEPAGDETGTAYRVAESICRAELGALEPAGSGTATRADAAMSAAIATMNLVRTMSGQATRGCQAHCTLGARDVCCR